MDSLKFKQLYKNNSTKRFEEMKAASNRRTKQQREASRHEMRQTNRNISDSEEENAAPVPKVELHHQSKQFRVQDAKTSIMLQTDEYHRRLHRLRELQERKRMLQQKKALQNPPFISYVSSTHAREEMLRGKKPKPTNINPLREKQPMPTEKRASPAVKIVKARVDCWLKRKPLESVQPLNNGRATSSCKKNLLPTKPAECFPKPIAVVKSAKKVHESKKPSCKPTINVLAVNQQIAKQTAFITSTARKQKMPLTFSFDAPSSRSVASHTKNTLTVVDADTLFDGISPIDVEPSPKKRSIASPMNRTTEGDSIWEPQPVAAINETTYVGPAEVDIIVLDDSPGVISTEVVMPPQRVAALNESFTICYNVDPVEGNAEDSIFGCHRPIIMSEPVTTTQDVERLPVDEQAVNDLHMTVSAESNIIPAEAPPPSPPTLPPSDALTSNRGRSSSWSVTRVSGDNAPSPGLENAKVSTDNTTEPTNRASLLLRKRSSLTFIEETIRSVISPSVSNHRSDEAKDTKELDTSPKRRYSSSSSSGPVALGEDDDTAEDQETSPPKEVIEKTNFYYEKVDSELARLGALCSEYAPYLEQEGMNDHCKGLILAAQGQTNILIQKKLTKFRDLIGHCKNKWNDQKVRNDDLDGFWLMLSLDLENLDKRFAELRLLRENNWKESEPDPPPKTKKLLPGGGVKKRPKPKAAAAGGAMSKPSSSIAELIRKARQEQQKQKAANTEQRGTLADTVTLVKTPVRKSVRIAVTPKRSSGQKRSSLCAGCSPAIVQWEEHRQVSPTYRKRHTIFPEITRSFNNVKSILKTPRATEKQRAKSVLFLDSGLDTPQTRRRQSSRKVVDTPKPKLKFNDDLEIEHIDNLAARTPSRLDRELEKRRRQSHLMASFSTNDDCKHEERETPVNTNSVKRRNRSSARKLSAALWNTEDHEVTLTSEVGSSDEHHRVVTRSLTKTSRKRTLDFS